eukprot:CAMPEP_0177616178 /NCGR_PEP_ID=MMETSP0419_2-20121207/23968_1 /TAXON_ID=582737 /ORGANISM="Tetraselmis sp., Strain GSL018" /LENGTH=197 /DNA_ID=CAMNT_0019114121 /DNA_START=719 /DNA_END=1309 /DNA_ORIENTATION=-
MLGFVMGCLSVLIGESSFIQIPLFWVYLPPYCLFFAGGVIAKQNDWLKTLPEQSRTTRACIYSSCAVAALCISALWAARVYSEIPDMAFVLVSYTFKGIFAVMASLSLLRLFSLTLNLTNVFIKFLSDASYTVYLIHGWTLTLVTWTFAQILMAYGEDLFLDAFATKETPLSGYYLVLIGGVYTGLTSIPLTWAISW